MNNLTTGLKIFRVLTTHLQYTDLSSVILIEEIFMLRHRRLHEATTRMSLTLRTHNQAHRADSHHSEMNLATLLLFNFQHG